MNLRHLTSAFTALAVTGTALVATTAPAQSAQKAPGTTSLATVLAADGNKFDKNWNDFDILEKAVRAVLKANPNSSVTALADGNQALTAFAPTDRAFRLLAEDLTGKTLVSERSVYRTLKRAATAEQVEGVLLYHVVAGKTLTYKKLKSMNGRKLTTALAKNAKIKVKVKKGQVILVDRDKDDANARIIVKLKDLNKGNKQIAQGIDRVLRPFDLESAL